MFVVSVNCSFGLVVTRLQLCLMERTILWQVISTQLDTENKVVYILHCNVLHIRSCLHLINITLAMSCKCVHDTINKNHAHLNKQFQFGAQVGNLGIATH